MAQENKVIIFDNNPQYEKWSFINLKPHLK